jgi:histidinol-phosphate aminotransferase
MKGDLVRPGVKGIVEYLPGKTPTEPGIAKLASNENPFGPSPKALEAIAREAKNLHTYPDQKSRLLRDALAKKLNLMEACIICGNGSDDLMQIIGATYLNPGDEVVIAKNTFSVYELIARIFDGRMKFVGLKDYALDLEGIAAAVTIKTKIVFLTNPNNPTGTIFGAAQFDAFMKKVPQNLLVVVDEAYAEYVESRDFPDAIKHIKEGRNVIVLRTFSKFYGLAGLRLGFALGKQELLAPMFKTKMPFNVNRLAQAGGLAALGDKAFLDKTFMNNVEGKKYLYAELDKLGLDYKKTEANFIFIDLKKSADEFFAKMRKQKVIIRPLTSFGLPQAIRVSIGTKEQNEKLISATKLCFLS